MSIVIRRQKPTETMSDPEINMFDVSLFFALFLLQINVDHHIREEIKRSLEKPSLSCFDEAQKHVYLLMERDSCPRFLHSDAYLRLKHRSRTFWYIQLRNKVINTQRCSPNPRSLSLCFLSLFGQIGKLFHIRELKMMSWRNVVENKAGQTPEEKTNVSGKTQAECCWYVSVLQMMVQSLELYEMLYVYTEGLSKLK